MEAVKIAAIVLIITGILGLVYGGFSYTKETHEAKLGPIELSLNDKQRVNVPVWAGVGAIILGGVLLVVGSKRSYSVLSGRHRAGGAALGDLVPPSFPLPPSQICRAMQRQKGRDP